MASRQDRPEALEKLPQITFDKRSTHQESFVNRLGLMTSIVLGIVSTVAIVRYAAATGADNANTLVGLLFVCLFLFALAPRAVIRKMGELRDVGAVMAFARKHKLRSSKNDSHDEYNRLAVGMVDDLPTALMLRSSQADWSTSHTRFTVPCNLRFEAGSKTPLDVVWHPKLSALGRLNLPVVQIEGGILDKRVDTLGPDVPATMPNTRLLALMGEDVQKLISQIARGDTVVTLQDRRLELWLNAVDYDLAGLDLALVKLKRLRDRLTAAADGPLPERLLFLVMNSKPDFRDQCVAALRTHFPNSEEWKAAERFLQDAGGGHLSLAVDETAGSLALVHHEGGVALAEDGAELRATNELETVAESEVAAVKP